MILLGSQRQKLEDLEDDFDNEDRPELEDEKPQIVVLKSGDLTAEEVAAEEKRLAKGKEFLKSFVDIDLKYPF